MIKLNLNKSIYIGFNKRNDIDLSKSYIKITMNMDATNREIELKMSMEEYHHYKEILEALKVEFAGQKFSIIFK